MLSYIIGAFLLVLFFAIVFTFWVTRRIVGPLNKLIAATADIGSGTEDINLLVDSDDEIGLLSRVLNDAYGKIREYSAYINALAYKDALTGLKNRTAYSEAVEEINREIKNGEPVFGVIVADVNYLKKANDTYGHEAGNELLIRTSKALTETFKTSSVFRIGGDEFAVILRGTEVETYGEMIENLKKSFLSTYITVHDGEIPVSVAMGISIFDPSKDQTYEDVFDKADQAMYLDKTSMKVIR
jgi:diguanylate cyclase (GGDEF)-like protein